MELSRKQAAIFLWKATGWEKGHALQSIFATMRHLRTMTGDETADGDGQLVDVTGGGTVLLVEDEDPVCLFARALRSKEYKVVEARNR